MGRRRVRRRPEAISLERALKVLKRTPAGDHQRHGPLKIRLIAELGDWDHSPVEDATSGGHSSTTHSQVGGSPDQDLNPPEQDSNPPGFAVCRSRSGATEAPPPRGASGSVLPRRTRQVESGASTTHSQVGRSPDQDLNPPEQDSNPPGFAVCRSRSGATSSGAGTSPLGGSNLLFRFRPRKGGRMAPFSWSGREDSNLRPSAPKAEGH